LHAVYINIETLHLTSLTIGYPRDDYNTTCVRYTQLLHEYNDIRDVGQGLMELIADARGVRQVEVVREFGFSEED
jgi:DNA repair protein Swi5/Sae3